MREVGLCLRVARRTVARVVVADRGSAAGVLLALDVVSPAPVAAAIAMVHRGGRRRSGRRCGRRRRSRCRGRRRSRRSSRVSGGVRRWCRSGYSSWSRRRSACGSSGRSIDRCSRGRIRGCRSGSRGGRIRGSSSRLRGGLRRRCSRRYRSRDRRRSVCGSRRRSFRRDSGRSIGRCSRQSWDDGGHDNGRVGVIERRKKLLQHRSYT